MSRIFSNTIRINFCYLWDAIAEKEPSRISEVYLWNNEKRNFFMSPSVWKHLTTSFIWFVSVFILKQHKSFRLLLPLIDRLNIIIHKRTNPLCPTSSFQSQSTTVINTHCMILLYVIYHAVTHGYVYLTVHILFRQVMIQLESINAAVNI